MAGETAGIRWVNPEDDALEYFADRSGLSWVSVKGRSVSGRNIDAIGYHVSIVWIRERRVARGTLGIMFHGGRVYLYPVSRHYYSSLLSAASPGKWFWEHMRRTNIGWYRM